MLEDSTSKKYLTSQKDDELIFPVADVQQNCQEETTNSEYPLEGGTLLQGVKISAEKFKANPERR